MVTVSQGDVWWADLGEPRGSGPGFRRPVVVIQGNPFNRSRLSTVVCVALTSNMKWAAAPGNSSLTAAATGLAKDSVANVTQIVTVNKTDLIRRAGKLPKEQLNLMLSGIDVLLGR